MYTLHTTHMQNRVKNVRKSNDIAIQFVVFDLNYFLLLSMSLKNMLKLYDIAKRNRTFFTRFCDQPGDILTKACYF